MKTSSSIPKQFPLQKPFFVVIMDDDEGVFNVVGPMSNDERLNADICAEQEKGRSVRCFTSGNYQTKEELVAEVKSELNLVYDAKFQI